MARIVIQEAQHSHKIDVNGTVIKICACGLSKTFPICDGSHHKTKDEEPGKLYSYDADGNRHEILHK